jgi:hypothetical protein
MGIYFWFNNCKTSFWPKIPNNFYYISRPKEEGKRKVTKYYNCSTTHWKYSVSKTVIFHSTRNGVNKVLHVFTVNFFRSKNKSNADSSLFWAYKRSIQNV